MKNSFFLVIFVFIFFSCIGKNSVAIKSKSQKAATTTSATNITVTSIKLVNNQFVLTGTNLDSATSVVIKESGSTMSLAIESQSSSTLIANGLAQLTLAAGKVFEFIVTNASASATYTVDFSLCSSTLGGKYFDCTTTPNDKEVLSYDAVSGKWKPRSVNGLSYQGVWNATTSLPTATTEGDYYIVSVASGSYAVGDWIVYNGSTFEEIDNSTVVTSVFGRTGAVTGAEGDYVLAKMGDVDFSATPTTNQVLKFNGTNWVGATLSTVETDPNVMTFAKITLPTCGASEVLKGNGTSLSCVTVSSGSGSSFSGTASRAIVTDGTGALAVSAVTSTELGYVSGVTSAIQTQLSAFQTYAKTPIPTCGSGEVLKSNGTTFSCVTDNTGSGSFSGTASRAVVTDGTGILSSSAVTSTEVGYLSGVTSAIQTQITAKQETITATTDLTANSLTTDSQAGVTLSPYNTGAGQTGEIRFYELAANGSNYVGIKSPDTLSANYTMTLPTTPGTPGQVLSATGSGVLGWIDNSLANLALTSGNIIVGSAGNVAASVTMSGDATMANTGALTIAANSVALGTDTTGNYLLNLTASNGLQATAAAGEGTTPNLVLGGALTGATTITQGANNFLFDLTSTGIFSVLAGANGLSISNLGVTTLTSAVLTTADINGGTLDDVTIGATTRAPGSFTTIAGTSAAIAGTVSAGTLLTSNILGGTTTTSGLNFKTTSGVGTTTADMHFLVGNNGATEALTILNNGNIGIGIATPVAKLEVNGDIKPGDSSATCDGTTEGSLKYNSTYKIMQFCDGTSWRDFNASGASSVVAKNANYTVLLTDRGKIFNVSNTTTITLPSAVTAGNGFKVVVNRVGSGVVTVAADGTETINGETTVRTIRSKYKHLTFVSDAVGWNIIEGDTCTYGSQAFSYTGADQTFTVPDGCTSIVVKAWGAGGGGGGASNGPVTATGGGGGYSTATIAVTAGESLTVMVGQGGHSGDDVAYTAYGGGGAGCGSGGGCGNYGGGGGGRSAVTRSSEDLIIAGGGGGGQYADTGGAGGGFNGQNGSEPNIYQGSSEKGYGGSQSAGGSGASGNQADCSSGGSKHTGGTCTATYFSGGGGGYFGGAGGASNVSSHDGGGGGSGYISAGGTTITGVLSVPANSTDADRNSMGDGGAVGVAGDNGRVVIYWGI